MQSGDARCGDVQFYLDMTIALACLCTVAYFVVVIEYCIGRGELTRAQLSLLDGNVSVAHSITSIGK
jgi:hypothetical protein